MAKAKTESIEIPFLGGAYEGRSKSINAQQSINLFPVLDQEEGKTVIAMYGTPGTTVFSEPGTTAIVRSIHVMRDYLYAVIGADVYMIDSDGVANDLGSITTSTGHVGMASNGVQLLIVDGTGSGFIVSEGVLSEIADGLEWTSRTSSDDNDWESIVYGGDLYVAVASSGTGDRVMTSPNGIDWTTQTSSDDNDWECVTYGDGKYVAVASSGGTDRVMTSTNGTAWTTQTSATNNDWYGVAYGGGTFVAVAASGTNNRVMTSTNGTSWTSRTSAANNSWRSVTYGAGLFVAVASSGTNKVMTSPDGTTWTIRTAASDSGWRSVTYGNNLFVAVADSGTNRVMTSPDGITWTLRSAAAANQWYGVTYGSGVFVAVSATGSSDRVMTSPDGITWQTRNSAADNTWMGVEYNDGLYVAVSTSGTNTRVMTSAYATGSFPVATDCIFFDGYFVVTVLNSGKIQISGLYNGNSWDPLDFATAESSPDNLVGIGSTRQNIWLFGEYTTEIYYNSGNPDFPFERVPGAVIDVGCESLTSVAEINGELYWLSDKKTIVKNEGYGFKTVSPPAINYQISKHTVTNNAVGYSYTLEGRTFYVINFPSDDKTWVLNTKTGQWHEWTSPA